jgi:hypothetical protein
MPTPRPGDFITVNPQPPGFDYQMIAGMGELEILEVRECTSKEDGLCTNISEDCILVILDLDPDHLCYQVPFCYDPEVMTLRQVSHDEHTTEDIIVAKGKEDVIVFEGKKHKVIKNTGEVEDLDDLII